MSEAKYRGRPMTDPQLQQAMAEIRAILQQYRIAGAITLVSKTHAEFGYGFPDWSVIQPEVSPHGEQGMRIRSFEEYYDTPEDQKLALEQSLSCVYQIRDIAGYSHQVFTHLTAQIEAICEVQVRHEPLEGFELLPEEDGA